MFQNINPSRLVVLVLIVIVWASAIVFAFANASGVAADEKILKDVTKISQVLKLYFDENGFYPMSSDNLPKGIEAYLNFYPSSAKSECSYIYERRSSGTDYKLSFCLSNKVMRFANSKGIQ